MADIGWKSRPSQMRQTTFPFSGWSMWRTVLGMTPTQKKSWIGLAIAAVGLLLLLTIPAVVSSIHRQNERDSTRDCYIQTQTGGQC